MPDRNHPLSGRTACAHADVRYFADEGGAVACCDCARLFGHLRPDGTFVSHNPGPPRIPLPDPDARGDDRRYPFGRMP